MLSQSCYHKSAVFKKPCIPKRSWFHMLHESDPVSPAVTWSASCAAAGSHAGLMSPQTGDVAVSAQAAAMCDGLCVCGPSLLAAVAPPSQLASGKPCNLLSAWNDSRLAGNNKSSVCASGKLSNRYCHNNLKQDTQPHTLHGFSLRELLPSFRSAPR